MFMTLNVFICSPENVLGDGSFARVYRARYKNQAVAVKVPNSMGDIHPHKLMRQEVSITQRTNGSCMPTTLIQL